VGWGKIGLTNASGAACFASDAHRVFAEFARIQDTQASQIPEGECQGAVAKAKGSHKSREATRNRGDGVVAAKTSGQKPDERRTKTR